MFPFGPELYLYLINQPSVCNLCHEISPVAGGVRHQVRNLPLKDHATKGNKIEQSLNCYVDGVVSPLNDMVFNGFTNKKYPVLSINGETVEFPCIVSEAEYFLEFKNEDTIS